MALRKPSLRRRLDDDDYVGFLEMIFTQLGPDAPFYRAPTPRWAHLAASDAATAACGRFNRPSVEARYLAEMVEAALSDYPQSSTSMHRQRWHRFS